MLKFEIFDTQIKIIIRFCTAMSIKVLFKVEKFPNHKQTLNLKYVSIDFAAPNHLLK